jgi:nicotinamide phosphoribosyltransferase
MNLFAPFNSDGYKLAHAMMYANGTEEVYSNLTPRSDRIYRANSATRYYDGKLVLLGVSAAFQEIVESWKQFFDMDKGIALARQKLYLDFYLGPDAVSIDNLSKLHDIGYLPLEVKSLEEGTKVPMGIPVLTVRNTVAHAYWLVNFLETTISNLTWKASTVATIAAEYRAMLVDFALRTGGSLDDVNWQAHAFACRGMSGPEDSARSEIGHIASFLGTDSLGSVMYAQQYMGAGNFVAASVPATEHAVATSNILRIEQELIEGTYEFINEEHENILEQMCWNHEDDRLIAEVMFAYELMHKFPKGVLSYVMDSFDFWTMLSRGLRYLKPVILRRETNGITPGRLVARPDSGDPVEVVCGLGSIENVPGLDRCSVLDAVEGNDAGVVEYEGRYYKLDVTRRDFDDYIDEYKLVEVSYEEAIGAIEVLWNEFGGTITDKGYKLLDDHVRLIYGDSITPKRALAILEGLEAKGFCSTNVVFGIGSYTYQCVTRDTFGFAVKATHTVVNGKDIAIFKDPKTDSKKKSAKGYLYVGRDPIFTNNGDVKGYGEQVLHNDVSREVEQDETNLLRTIFKDGQFIFANMPTLDGVRAKLM